MSEEMVAPVVNEEVSVRRMPDNIKKCMIKLQGKAYLPAAFRIVWMRDEVGDKYGIETTLIEGGHADGYATVRAIIKDRSAGDILATAHKTEEKKDFPAGWVEKAEAGAISRALSYIGFGTQFDESITGYDDKGHVTDSPQPQRVTIDDTARVKDEAVAVIKEACTAKSLKPNDVLLYHYSNSPDITKVNQLSVVDWVYCKEHIAELIAKYEKREVAA